MFAIIAQIALKLWNRGIDISVGVITSTISAGLVAVIAIIFWNWKKKRDLRFEADKQRQQHRIAEDIDLETSRQAAAERNERLSGQRAEKYQVPEVFGKQNSPCGRISS